MSRPVLLWGFRPAEEAAPGLGSLEREVMDAVWRPLLPAVHRWIEVAAVLLR